MSPARARVAFLAAELRRDWEHVETNLAQARAVDPARSAPEASHVALLLDHSYQAFETLLVRIERALGLQERSGPTWHTNLLVDAGRPVPGLRPAIYPLEARENWEALLRFRHFLRHAYGVPLDPDELRKNVVRLERGVRTTRPHLHSVLSVLSPRDRTPARKERRSGGAGKRSKRRT